MVPVKKILRNLKIGKEAPGPALMEGIKASGVDKLPGSIDKFTELLVTQATYAQHCGRAKMYAACSEISDRGLVPLSLLAHWRQFDRG